MHAFVRALSRACVLACVRKTATPPPPPPPHASPSRVHLLLAAPARVIPGVDVTRRPLVNQSRESPPGPRGVPDPSTATVTPGNGVAGRPMAPAVRRLIITFQLVERRNRHVLLKRERLTKAGDSRRRRGQRGGRSRRYHRGGAGTDCRETANKGTPTAGRVSWRNGRFKPFTPAETDNSLLIMAGRQIGPLRLLAGRLRWL